MISDSWLGVLRVWPLALVVLCSACSLPPVSFEGDAGPKGRENFARFMTNRAVTAFYKGDDDAVEDSLAIALEVSPDFDEAQVFFDRRGDPYFRPGYLAYTAPPAMPEERELPGAIARGIAYPIWGLPWDLVEGVFKGGLAAPGLGAVFYPLTFLFYPYERPEPPPGPEPRTRVSVGVGVGVGGQVGSGVGFGVGGSPLVFFFLINGLPAIVYQHDWEDRLASYGRVGTWWWPWVAEKLHYARFFPERGLGSAFFSNARRIAVVDRTLIEARAELRGFEQVPIPERNRRLAALNQRLASQPRRAPRSAIWAEIQEASSPSEKAQ